MAPCKYLIRTAPFVTAESLRSNLSLVPTSSLRCHISIDSQIGKSSISQRMDMHGSRVVLVTTINSKEQSHD